jgi:hypothetical protein
MGVVRMRGILRISLRPLLRAWSRAALRSLTFVPRPDGYPRAHASGVDSDRVLLFGSGPAAGWGVLSHDLAMPGALARALSRLTGRGTDVDVLADPTFVASTAIRHLEDVQLWRYDAIVVSLGLNESLRLTSIIRWRRDLDRLLDHLVEATPSYVHIYVLGVRSVTPVMRHPSWIESVISGHRDALNRVSAELSAQRHRATFVEFEPMMSERDPRERSTHDYTASAIILSLHMAPALNAAFEQSSPHARDQRAGGHPEAVRQRAVDALAIVDTEPEQQFDRIVGFAQRAFGTASAAMTIIDNDRQWLKASVDAGPTISRELAICARTIEQSGALVVADASKDSRFEHFPLVDGEPEVRFYAGFPIEAPGGERIGALCVFDPAARAVEDVDRALLRDLALMVQKEVWLRAAAR